MEATAEQILIASVSAASSTRAVRKFKQTQQSDETQRDASLEERPENEEMQSAKVTQ